MPKIERGKRLEILRQLRDHGESYGLQMVNRSGGSLKRGTVYVVTGGLERDGLVAARVEESTDGPGLPKRHYSLTDDGKRAVNGSEAARVAYREAAAATA